MAKQGGRKKGRRTERGRENLEEDRTRPDTGHHQLHAVGQGQRCKNCSKMWEKQTWDQPTDQLIDRPTNQETDKVAYSGVLKVNQTHGRMNVFILTHDHNATFPQVNEQTSITIAKIFHFKNDFFEFGPPFSNL